MNCLIKCFKHWYYLKLLRQFLQYSCPCFYKKNIYTEVQYPKINKALQLNYGALFFCGKLLKPLTDNYIPFFYGSWFISCFFADKFANT